MSNIAEERRRYMAALHDANLENEARGLHIIANRLQRAEEIFASVEWMDPGETGEQYHERVTASAEKWLKGLVRRHPGLEYSMDGDVRGAVIKLRGLGLPSTSWGREGWFCVWADGYNEGQINYLVARSNRISEAKQKRKEAERAQG